MDTVVIAVGSENAAKLRAVSLAAEQLTTTAAWRAAGVRTVRVVGARVVSAVSAQPMSEEETMRGAMARAQAALAAVPAATYGVGLEGGVQSVGGRWLECGFIAVADRHGRTGLGTSARYELSAKVIARLQAGEELAQVVDDLTGAADVRSQGGAMGVLTDGLLPRDLCYSHGVLFAFAPFVSPPSWW